MTMPAWWNERRFGVFVQTTPASVPGWAPIGADAGWYRRHLGEPDGSSDDPSPLVEVLAHHRDRWGHVERYDDFVPLLSFEDFDADEWAQLVVDAGASYSVVVAKHHDGWTWWDAPASTRPLTEDGPRRDVVGEYAAACARVGIAFGASYSLCDRDGPGGSSVDDVLRAQLVDLVDRHAPVMLHGDGLDAGEHADGTITASIDAVLDDVHSHSPDLVINDGWHVSNDRPPGPPPIIRTIEGDPPDDITDGPWELVRGIGAGLAYNRAERVEHLLTGDAIVALYTEVLAKGGNLLLAVGPDADGTIPRSHTEPLREAGPWIRRFGPMLATTTPWTRWGDPSVRYLDEGHGRVLVVDLSGDGVFPALGSEVVTVTSIELADDVSTAVAWHHDRDGLHVEPRARRTQDTDGRTAGDVIEAVVYRVSVRAADRPAELFETGPPVPIALAPLVTGAPPGAIVQLGDGAYTGPAQIPDGVVVRGLGPDRTTIANGHGPTLVLGAGARLEHVRVAGRPASDAPAVTVSGASATLLGCAVDGSVEVRADDVLVRAITARDIVAVDADRLHVSRCDIDGGRRDVGIDLRGGGGQLIESNRVSGHHCSIRAGETTGTTVRGNTISGRWWGVHLVRCEDAHVHGNRIAWTMRAVDVDGGTQAVVDGNAVTDGDSGCIVEDGASNCEVYGNHWDRCRIGLLAWDAVALHHQDNIVSSLLEPDGALVTGP